MKIEEFATMLGVTLKIEWVPNQNRWGASLSPIEFKKSKDDNMLSASWGWGADPLLALVNLVKFIKQHEVCVLNAWSGDRREYPVPKDLTY